MISSEIFIIKRDGKREVFSLDKIKNAIAKAFLSVGSFATQDVITNVLSRVSVSDGTSVEEIQNQVEVALMSETSLDSCLIIVTLPILLPAVNMMQMQMWRTRTSLL